MTDEWLLEWLLATAPPRDVWSPPLFWLLPFERAQSFWVRLIRINSVICLLLSLSLGILTACERLTAPQGLLFLTEVVPTKWSFYLTFLPTWSVKCLHSHVSALVFHLNWKNNKFSENDKPHDKLLGLHSEHCSWSNLRSSFSIQACPV